MTARIQALLLTMFFAVAVVLAGPASATSETLPLHGVTADPSIVVPPPDDPGPIPAPAPALRRAVVITVGFAGSGTTPKGQPDLTPATISNTFRLDVNPWFEKVSHGRFPGFSRARVGPVTVSPSNPVCGDRWLSEVSAQADAATRRLGLEPNGFDTVIYYFKKPADAPACTKADGWAQQHGRHVWLNGKADLRTLAHELGHHLGLGHAGAQFCSDRNGNRVPLSAPLETRCTQAEYGDAYSAMGGGDASLKYSSAELAKLGWNLGRVATISAGAPTVTKVLRTMEEDVPGSTQALRLVDGATTLWVEYRQNIFDPFNPQGALLVRAEQPSLPGATTTNPGPFLLDMSPNDGDHTREGGTGARQELRVGQAWTNPLGEMTIWLNSADFFNATVTIQSAPAPVPAPLPSGRVVPSVIGDTPATATSKLAASGLVRGTIGTTIDCESLGKVVSQSPVAGTQLPSGGVVDIRYGVERPGGCGTSQ